MTLKEIMAKLAELNADAKAIMTAADEAAGEGQQGTLSAENSAKVDAIYAEYDTLKAKATAIEAASAQRDRLAEHEDYMSQSVGRPSAPLTPEGAPASPNGDAGKPITLEFRGEPITFDPAQPLHVRATAEYRQAFVNYLLDGAQAGLQTSPNPQGGYLAPTQIAYDLLSDLDDEVFMRPICNVLPPLTSAVSLGQVTLDTDLDDSDWTPEVPASDISEDDSLRLGMRELTPHLVSKLVKLSMKLLRVAAINPETLLRQRLAYKFGVTEEKAFLLGDGVQKPLGVFVASDDGIPTSRDVIAASTTAVVADELIDMVYFLKGGHIKAATWLLHRDMLKRVRKLKDSDGQYIWQPGLQGGQPDRLLDRPIVMSEYAPNTFTEGQYVAILGNFKAGYWIVDSLQLEIQRLDQLFALKNQIGFVGRKETDGAPVLAEAFVRLRLDAS